jgi:hypothetical protein
MLDELVASLTMSRSSGPQAFGCLTYQAAASLETEPSLVADVVDDPLTEVLDTSGANGSMSSVQSFIDAFKRPLEQPLIASPPRLRITKDPRFVDDNDFVPKRSARLAAKSKYREPKPDAQARKVLMKKLGLEVETEKPDEASFKEFQQAFAPPLSPSTREAMQVLFPGRLRYRPLLTDVE